MGGKIYSYDQMISELGEIPYCQCEDINKNNCGLKVNVKPNKFGSYRKYKNEGYPKFITGHNSKGKNNPTFNKKFTQESKDKMSASRLEYIRLYPESIKRGKDHQSWNGGNTPLEKIIRHCEEYSNWRTQVFERDQYICQDCQDMSKNDLIVHHIIPFNLILKQNNIISFNQALQCEPLWELNNGITLCINCHNKIPRYNYKLLNVGEINAN